MFKKTLIPLIVLSGIAMAGTTTVVLQNGLDSYTGAEDNYIARDIYTPQPDTTYMFFTCG